MQEFAVNIKVFLSNHTLQMATENYHPFHVSQKDFFFKKKGF